MRLKFFNGFVVVLFILERALAFEDHLEYDIEAPDRDQTFQKRGKNILELNIYFNFKFQGVNL